MPYITKEKRDVLDPHIQSLINALRELESDDPNNVMAGNANYIFTRILDSVYSYPRYDDINTVIGICQCVSYEFYRRIAAPYEDNKMKDNGEVYLL